MSFRKNCLTKLNDSQVFQRSKSCANLRRPVVTSTPLKTSAASVSFCVSPIENPRGKRLATALQTPSAAALPVPLPKTSQIPRVKSVSRHVAAKVDSNLPVKKNVAPGRRYPSLSPDESVVPVFQTNTTKKQIVAPALKSSSTVVKARGESTSKTRSLSERGKIDVEDSVPETSKSRAKHDKHVTVSEIKKSKEEKPDKTFTSVKSQKAEGGKLDQTVIITKSQKPEEGKLAKTTSVAESQKLKEQKRVSIVTARNSSLSGTGASTKVSVDFERIPVMARSVNRSAKAAAKSSNTTKKPSSSQMHDAEVSSNAGKRGEKSEHEPEKTKKNNQTNCQLDEAESNEASNKMENNCLQNKRPHGQLKESAAEENANNCAENEPLLKKRAARQETRRGVKPPSNTVDTEVEVAQNVVDKPSTSRRGATKVSKTAAAISVQADGGESREVIISVDTQKEEAESKAPVKRGRRKLADETRTQRVKIPSQEDVCNKPEESTKQERIAEEAAHVDVKVSKRKVTSKKVTTKVLSQAETSGAKFEVPEINESPVIKVEVLEPEYEAPVERSKRKAVQSAEGKHHEETQNRTNEAPKKPKAGQKRILKHSEEVPEPVPNSDPGAAELQVEAPLKPPAKKATVKASAVEASNGVRKRKASEVKQVSFSQEKQSENITEPLTRRAKKQIEEQIEPSAEVLKKKPLKRRKNSPEYHANETIPLDEVNTKDRHEDVDVSRPKRMRKDEDTVQSQRRSSRASEVPKKRPARTLRQKNVSVVNLDEKENNPKSESKINLSEKKCSSTEACSSSSVPKIELTSSKYSQAEEDSSDPERDCPTKAPLTISSYFLPSEKKLADVGYFWNHKPKYQRHGVKGTSKSFSTLMLFAHDHCGVQCGIMEIPPGAVKRKASHEAYDILLTVLSGSGIFKINTLKFLMKTGELCVVIKGSMYTVHNVADIPLRMSVMKMPRPSAES